MVPCQEFNTTNQQNSDDFGQAKECGATHTTLKRQNTFKFFIIQVSKEGVVKKAQQQLLQRFKKCSMLSGCDTYCVPPPLGCFNVMFYEVSATG